MTTLITGGAGFLGSALARALLAAGDEVHTLDRVQTERLPDHPNHTFFLGDVRDEVTERIAAADRVIHLAAIAGVDEYIQRPEEVLDTNILGTRNVLRACADLGRPVVLASTSEAYGKNDALLDEGQDTIVGPSQHRRWSYAISKLAGEHYAHALADRGLTYAIVRYFNVYGPHLDAPGSGRVIGKFLGALRDGEPLVLVDGGQAIRSFCYVDDAVAATRIVLDALPGISGEVVNIGNAEPVSIAELAERMARLADHQAGTVNASGVEHFGAGFEEIPRRIPDLDRLRRLGFEARISLRKGLKRTLNHWGQLRAPEATVAPAPLPAVRPRFHVEPRLLSTIGRALRSGQVTNDGPMVRRLEAALADWLGVDDVVATGSGSDALGIAVRLMGWRGRVALPSYTYIATANALTLSGLEPVFCDIDPETWVLDPASVPADVAGVVPVNVFGVHAPLGPWPVVYDNAHGLGSELDGKRLPDVVQALSLHATKVLPAVEGGLVYSPDPAHLAEARRIRRHGLASNPLRSGPGWNGRMDEIRAAIALTQLEHLDADLARRREMAEALREGLVARGYAVQRVPEGQRSAFLNLGARVPAGADPYRVLAHLNAQGIGARRYFSPPLHHMDGWPDAQLPVTDAVWRTLISFPIYSDGDPEEVTRILEASVTPSE